MLLNIFLLALLSFAQAPAPVGVINENPVKIQVHLDSEKVAPGMQAKLMIDMTVAPGHHAYKDMIQLRWLSEEGVTLDPFEAQPIHQFFDPFSKKNREALEDQATVTAMVHFPSTLGTGLHKGKISFTYQACSAQYCLFPKTQMYAVNFTVVDKKEMAQMGMAEEGSPLQDDFHKFLARGKIWAFIFVFIGGFLTSLTPCIFPMIPITISIIGARSAKNKKSSFALSVFYVLGIAFTYSLLGVLAASTGAFFGSVLSNIWVVSAIAIVFVAMGLSMLGFFEVQVPAFIRHRVGKSRLGSGLPGAFAAGLFAGIVASPCIGPVLVSILAFVAQTAQIYFGFLLLFTFALGMGVLFIVLGTFSGLLTKLPKAGPWMEFAKFVFGVTLIGMALFYINPLISRALFHVLVSVFLILGASYYGAFAPAGSTHRGQLLKGFWLATFFAGLCFIALAVFNDGLLGGKVLWHSTNGVSSVNKLQWKPYDDASFSNAIANHQPILIDFSAEWCVACHELEKFTYSDTTVVEAARPFTLLEVDATKPSPTTDFLQKKYNVIGLPTVIFIDAQGRVRKKLTVTGFVKSGEFTKRIKATLQAL